MIEVLFLLIVLISVAFCFRPFFRDASLGVSTNTMDTPLGRMYQRKETLLQNIADLDFEFDMGKLSEEDFQGMRGGLKTQALETIEQIALLEESETLLEGKIKVRHSTPEKPLEASTGFCPSCGASLTTGARFCSSCGTKVEDAR